MYSAANGMAASNCACLFLKSEHEKDAAQVQGAGADCTKRRHQRVQEGERAEAAHDGPASQKVQGGQANNVRIERVV